MLQLFYKVNPGITPPNDILYYYFSKLRVVDHKQSTRIFKMYL